MENNYEKFETVKKVFFDTFVNQNIALGIELSLFDIQNSSKLIQLFYLINIYRKIEQVFDVTNKEIYLNFDITHSENDYQILEKFIEKIEDKNIVITLNEFSSGYLNICDLRNNNPSFIKIDESFIQGYCINESVKLKTKQIFKITKEMNIGVLVEHSKNANKLKVLHNLEVNVFKRLKFNKINH